MPNICTAIHQKVQADHPGASVKRRGYDWLDYDLGGGQGVFVQQGGGLHYWDGNAWQEMNTDWGTSQESGYTDGNQTAQFHAHVGGNSERKVYPRRDNTGEYWVLGRPQYWNGSQWRNVNLPGRIKNGHLLTWDTTAIAFTITHTGHGMAYEVTLKNATFAANVRWAITMVGLHWDGWNLVSDATGKVVTRFPVPWMRDANGVKRQVAATNTGGYITFTPDYAGLVYPVVIS